MFIIISNLLTDGLLTQALKHCTFYLFESLMYPMTHALNLFCCSGKGREQS